MPGGIFSQGEKAAQKNQGRKPTNTVQTLLAARKDLDSSKTQQKTKQPKRTHSELSSESDNSIDMSGLSGLQKDLDEIKVNLQGITKKDDLDTMTKDLVRTQDLETIVTSIVNKLFQKFESSVEKKINTRVTQVQKEMQEKIDALSVENEDLRRRVDQITETVKSNKRAVNENLRLSQEAIDSANYNEQYSRKNNVKMMNFPRREKQDLRADFIDKVKKDLNVELQDRDVVAIHRLPSHQPGPNPVIVKFFNSDIKRKVMRVRKDLKDNVRLSDDVTKRNMQLIHKLRDMNCFESVWYYNCGVYGRTDEGIQLKFRLFDDIRTRLLQKK